MPSKRRVSQDRRREGLPAIPARKRLAIGSRPLTIAEELLELSFRVDELLLFDRVSDVPCYPFRQEVVVILVY